MGEREEEVCKKVDRYVCIQRKGERVRAREIKILREKEREIR